ncbi:MAG TPA: AAA family ATPase, partial [Thermoleophilaceae bacterium]|nr:AAA family ATPase [Thermoleophilaceae bacterium]
LAERERELTALQTAVELARAGEGGVLVVEGPAGIGKTVLLDSAAGIAEDRGHTVLRALGSEVERDFPFGVVRELLEPALRRADSREQLLSGSARLCAPLFEGGDPSDLGETGLLHGLYWLLCALAERGPLALLIDDAQWADARSLDLLAFVAPRVGELPLALIVATRPDEGMTAVLGRGAERIQPAPLSASAVGELVGEQLGPPEPSFVAACHEATAGNPFYVGELIRALAADGISPTDGAAVQGLGPDRVAAAALARATADAVPLVRALAILGDGSELRLVAALAGIEEEAAGSMAGALTRSGVLATDRPPRFAHPIVLSSIAAELTPAERARANGRAAALLAASDAPPARVAGHLLESDPVGEPWASRALVVAARQARAEGAPAFAARCLRRALVEPGAGAELRRELGDVAFLAGEPDALEQLEAAWRGAPDDRERARVARSLAVPLVGAGRADEAVDRVLQASATLAADDPASLELMAELSSLALLAPMDLTLRVMEQLEQREPPPGQTGAECVLLANLAYWHAMRGAPAAECLALARQALAGDVLLGEEGPASPSLSYAVLVLISADAFAEADAHLAAALARSRETGSVLGFTLTSLMRSMSAYRQGALADAEADARHATDTARLHGWGEGLPGAVGFLVDALVERGRLDEAAAALERAGFDGVVPPGLLFNAVLVARGRLAIARGQLAEGVEDLRELGRRSELEGARSIVGTPTWRSYAVPAMAGLGEREEAARLADEELVLAREWGAPRAIGTALRAKAATVEDPEEAIAWLEEAVALLEPARLEHARALVDLGAALRRARRPREAREPLRLALDLAVRCDAAPLAERATHELEASGARRVDRTLLSGVEALTPSERRIASMAASGMSNREIAEALFLTRKTIEMHLGSAYKKLDVSSRDALPAVLAGGKPRVAPGS